MKVHLMALLLAVGACSAPPDPKITGPADPEAPVSATQYQPALSGTAPHGPAELKSWRELNDDVAPGAGKSR